MCSHLPLRRVIWNVSYSQWTRVQLLQNCYVKRVATVRVVEGARAIATRCTTLARP